MTFTDYLIDSLLVLVVLVQIRERELTVRMLVLPFLIAGAAVALYLDGVPTAGNDLVLVAALGLTGGLIGLASGRTVLMRLGTNGAVLARSGWSSAVFWVLGMGSRFAFIFWMTHGGHQAIAGFSATHAITGAGAWTAALLAMAVLEVAGRSGILALRRRALAAAPAPELA